METSLPHIAGAAGESVASGGGAPSTHRGLAEEVIGSLGSLELTGEIIEDMDDFWRC